MDAEISNLSDILHWMIPSTVYLASLSLRTHLPRAKLVNIPQSSSREHDCKFSLIVLFNYALHNLGVLTPISILLLPRHSAVTVVPLVISTIRDTISTKLSMCRSSFRTCSEAPLSTTMGVPFPSLTSRWVLLQLDGPLPFFICNQQAFFLSPLGGFESMYAVFRLLWGFLTLFLTYVSIITLASELPWIVPSSITVIKSLSLWSLVVQPSCHPPRFGQGCGQMNRFILITHSCSSTFQTMTFLDKNVCNMWLFGHLVLNGFHRYDRVSTPLPFTEWW